MNLSLNIPFNRPLMIGGEPEAIQEAVHSGMLAGNGSFTSYCEGLLSKLVGALDVLLTPSCTHALEMAALLIDIGPGDEVIMPSWTFVSTANAFVLRGAIPVFVDISTADGNLDVTLIEAAITPRTRAIVPVHYGGVACDMDAIMLIAERHALWVIEDAAQAVMSNYKNRHLGSIGHLGAFSFHATKNYTSGGEGGALVVNDASFLDRARILREKGTNREAFASGAVNQYQWLDIGSSFLMSELQAAFLSVQLDAAQAVKFERRARWENYASELAPLSDFHGIKQASVPDWADHNGHIFFLKARDLRARNELLAGLNAKGVCAQAHYVPLHLSPAGKQFGRNVGACSKTVELYERLVRLPVFHSLTDGEQAYVIDSVEACLRGC
ncbi:hypothetical protein Q670_07335 [Alcanivorax sp. P2S70]|uniref:dTDP-4-amino-4,6-dideoxygalactose transaminase n=1 Tax=Alcanivorax profundi TaxID=2338368 RepID=A0A418Y3L2_9GAMM|nr:MULTISPECIES: dTDP-4-amino-4,6-dideoxygalactose transaminase [Alcanivorax]ERP93185.1 hypothetical protein Q670_07335 [Alcanivorax sp. P2S70]RJG20073.1 dTDP-4-amino-4,6-dideoxygalactose transaminase [Alcanivorax profundi]